MPGAAKTPEVVGNVPGGLLFRKEFEARWFPSALPRASL